MSSFSYSPKSIDGSQCYVSANWGEGEHPIEFVVEYIPITDDYERLIEAIPREAQNNPGTGKMLSDQMNKLKRRVSIKIGTVLINGAKIEELRAVPAFKVNELAIALVRFADGTLIPIEAHYLHNLIAPTATEATEQSVAA